MKYGYIATMAVTLLFMGCGAKDGGEVETKAPAEGVMETSAPSAPDNPCASGEEAECIKAFDVAGENYTRRAQLAKAGCKRDFGFACLNLSFVYLEGKGGVAKDLSAADRYLQKSCDVGHSKSCVLLAGLLRGDVLPDDPKREIELLLKGCKRDDPESCFALGRRLISSRNRDEQLAGIDLVEKSCEAGHQPACEFIEGALEYSKSTQAKTKSVRFAGIDWEIDGAIAQRFDLKGVKCEKPFRNKRMCHLTIHFPAGWNAMSEGRLMGTVYDAEGVQTDSWSVSPNSVDVGGTVREKFLVGADTKRVTIRR